VAKNAYIRPQHVEAICHLIYGWGKPNIDWEAVCDAAQSVLGYRPSRSGLSSKAAIQRAFRARKQGLKIKPPLDTPKPNSLVQAAHVIAARNVEIAALKLTNRKLLEQFARWEYNAYLHRVTIEMLDVPLPVPDLIKVQGVKPGVRR
jgi:hypothetical protein